MTQQQRVTIPYEEWIALHSFYNSTNGNFWHYKGSQTNTTHWNFTSYKNNNPCFDQWAGIVCTCHHYNHPHYYSNYYTYSYYGTNPQLISLCNVQKIILNNYNLTGTIITAIGVFKNITILHLKRNNLYGTLPSELGLLKNIIKMGFAKNKLTGSIPSSLGNLNNMQHLYLYSNVLKGSIPSSLGNLYQLKILFLYSNFLSGTIPSSFGNLDQLQILWLHYNSLTGTIPSSIGNLQELLFLYLYNNYLTGTIPWSVGNIQELQYVGLNFNSLSGTIPSSIGNLQLLQQFEINSNSLTGTIPSSLGKIKNLQYYIFLNSNFLTGTIPSSLGNIKELQYFDLYSNYLTGIIPLSFGNMNQLQQLNLDSNFLTGIIPSSLRNLNQLQGLSLFSNHLTGTIPSSLDSLIQLQSLDFNSNYLTGTIPSSLGNLVSNLHQFYLDSNYLSGTIPMSFGNLTQLQYLDLDSNSLTGTIPSSLQNLKYLIILLLYSNQLHGNLINIFNSTLQNSLLIIQINNNQLTGSIPEEIFKLPNLNTFDAVSNCFSGDIPYSTICKSKTITNLILDGLHTATSCRQQIFPGSSLLSSAYTLKNNVFNKIDYCLFTMSSLSILHLSGNGFTGTLPNNISNSLKDLSLSHNLLTGTIPNSFQLKQWNNLDLSFNIISGTFSSDFSSQNYSSSLTLRQNRLSGVFPSSLIQLTSINVLSGNIFSCDATKSNIPQYDSDISNYSCGSNIFDITYYIWLGMTFCSLISFWICYFRKNYNKNKKLELFTLTNQVNLSASWVQDNISMVMNKVIMLMRIVSYLVAYIITILLTIYTVSGSYFGTYTNQYAWTVSIAFQSGTIAFGLTLAALCVLICLFLFLIIKIDYYKEANQSNTPSSYDQKIGSNKNQTTITSLADIKTNSYLVNIISSLNWTITPLINVIVVGGVNILYVFLFLNVSSNVIVILQILLAMFKSFWNGFGYQSLNRIINRHYNVESKSLNHSTLQLLVRLLNNIMIPCVVVAMINKDCFYNLIIPPPTVSSQFNYKYCSVFYNYNICSQYQYSNQITVFDPPYVYSYQCSSQFITFYSVAFVFLCLIDGFFIPLGQIIIVKLYNYGITNNQKWLQLLRNIVPRILKLDRIDNNDKMEIDKFHPYFDSLQLFLNNFTYLGLIMTFGAVFPPLAFSFFVTIVIMNYSFLFKVQRFVNYAKEKHKIEYIELINEECECCLNDKLVMRAVWMIITISCLFYSLFLFDTLGDAVGVNGAYWVLIVMPLFPLVTFIGYRVLCPDYNNNNNHNINNVNRESNLEIIIVGNLLRQSNNF